MRRCRPRAGVVVRADGRIAVIHRPRYDDWSLPKGKLEPGESFETGALREVEEETGIRGRIVGELEPTGTSTARAATRSSAGTGWTSTASRVAFAPNDEVDELRWLTPAEARDLLSYEHDRALVETVV